MLNTILTFIQQYLLFSMITQIQTISVALTCTSGQTSKKTYKNLNTTNSIEVTIIDVAQGGGGQEARAHSKRNDTNDKNVTKNFLFLHFQFLVASLHTTVLAHNDNYR